MKNDHIRKRNIAANIIAGYRLRCWYACYCRAVPAAAQDILPSGLVVANGIPTEEEKLRYSGEGMITDYSFTMDRDIQEVMPRNGYKEYIPGLMTWDVHIQGMGGIIRDSCRKDGIVINMQDGQRWLISKY